jgi:mono/diheme cytochrome c family protein
MKGSKMKFRYAGMIAIFSMLSFAAYVAVAADAPVTETATMPAAGADGFALPAQKKKSTAPEIPPLGSNKSPIDVAATAPKGSLINPYSYKTMNADLVEAGKRKYMGVSCNGCHGGNGGGGMCPPLSNETWVYGADDDTLFRLVALGSDELQKQGYTRKGRENVVGPMPAHGALVKTEDDLWRIIYFIRGNFRGDAKNITW